MYFTRSFRIKFFEKSLSEAKEIVLIKKIYNKDAGPNKVWAAGPHSSASRTDSDGGQTKFLESGRRRTPDEGGPSPSHKS